MKTTRRASMILAALAAALGGGAALAQQVKHDYWPGMDKAVPHVTGDKYLTNTFEDWKDENAIRSAKAAGKQSREVNFKDFRWMEKSVDGMIVMEEGRDFFHEPNAQGKSCASCHGKDGEKLRGTLANYPKYSDDLKRVIGYETQIARCADRNLGRKEWNDDSRANNMISFWLGSLSDGYPINVDMTDARIKASYERGKKLFFRRTGHFHFACASCHTPPTTERYLRGQRPSGFYGDASSYPIWHFPADTMQPPARKTQNEDRGYIFTLQHQIRSCMKLSRMFYAVDEGDPTLTDIETFLRASSNGYRISIPTKQYNLDTEYLLELEQKK